MQKCTKRALFVVLILVVAASFGFASGTEGDGELGVTTGNAVRRGQFGESPALAALVDAGQLDPVDQRIPKNPKVVEMIEGIGNYGGDLNVFAVNDNIFNNDMQGMKGTSLFRIPRSAQGLEPDVAEAFDVHDDGFTVTIYLREGMRWSDGAPFTTEDMRFASEDCTNNTEVRSWTNAGVTSVKIIDDYTIELFKPTGTGGAGIFNWADWFGGYAVMYQPSHYLKPYHIDYNDNANELAEEAGYETWNEAIRQLYWWAPMNNPDKPQVEPWDVVSVSETLRVSERNPYFFRVDAEGNQLPYIDRFIVQIVDNEVYGLKVAGGEADIAYNQTRLEDMALYVQGAPTGDYTVTLYPGVAIAETKFYFNAWHADEMKREVINDLRFRQALSVAINRAEIQEVIYQGLGRAGVIAPLESSSYYVDGWRDHYAQYDPDLANRLLDDVGLDGRDSDGFRTWPNGETLSEAILHVQGKFSSELELISEYYSDVGLKIIPSMQAQEVITEVTERRQHFATIHPNANIPPGNERASYSATWQWPHSQNMDAWEDLLDAYLRSVHGQDYVLPDGWMFGDFPEGASPGDYYELAGRRDTSEWVVRPPEHEIQNATDELAFTSFDMGTPEYVAAAKKFFDYQVKQLHHIGTVGEMPTVYIRKNGLRNTVPPGWVTGMPLRDDVTQTWMDQLYWE